MTVAVDERLHDIEYEVSVGVPIISDVFQSIYS
jgi:hypothetical protein